MCFTWLSLFCKRKHSKTMSVLTLLPSTAELQRIPPSGHFGGSLAGLVVASVLVNTVATGGVYPDDQTEVKTTIPDGDPTMRVIIPSASLTNQYRCAAMVQGAFPMSYASSANLSIAIQISRDNFDEEIVQFGQGMTVNNEGEGGELAGQDNATLCLEAEARFITDYLPDYVAGEEIQVRVVTSSNASGVWRRSASGLSAWLRVEEVTAPVTV